MELMASGCLNSSSSFPLLSLRPLLSISKDFPRSLSLIRNSRRKPSPFFSLSFEGSGLFTKRMLPSSPRVTANAGDTTAGPNNSVTEQLSLTEQPYTGANHEVPKSGEERGEDEDLGDLKMVRVCDKLIGVFLVDKPSPAEWRRLLVFSKTWSNVRPHFFKRCQERADNDDNPELKHKLLRLARKLQEVDADVERHNELLQVIKGAPSQIGEVVARRRKDFTREFFMHLHTVADSYYNNPTEQNEIAELGNTCLAAVKAFDTAAESIVALDAAELKFKDIMNSPTLDAACRKIDDLANKKQLDPATMLLFNKAWATVKDTDMTKDEAKEIMYHLYMRAREKMAREMPKEVRILKHLLTIKDPKERESALNDAFTPGPELEGDVDYLCTEPEKLQKYIRVVIDAYHNSREGTLVKAARDLMNIRVIKRLEALQKLIQDKFM